MEGERHSADARRGRISRSPSYRILLAIDIQGYGRAHFTDPVRYQIRQHLANWATELLGQAGAERPQWTLQDTGDGWIASIDPNVPQDLLLATVVAGLHHRLVGYNAGKPEPAQLRVRLAVHGGYVLNLLVGEATNEVCRLLDAQVMRACLTVTSQPLAVIASAWLYGGIIKHGYPGIDPAVWHSVLVDTKEGPRQGWVYVPGDPDAPHRASAEETPAADQPPRPRVAPANTTTGSSVLRRVWEERKVITVLAARVTSATGGTADPEVTRGLTDAAVGAVLAQVRQYGGVVQTRLADRILAVFGVPRSHEDDPERAVYAGLEICEQVRTLRANQQARVGVATGEALVSYRDDDPASVFGDVMHTAMALQDCAPPGGVAAGMGTYRATCRAVAYQELHSVLPGQATGPMAWQALAPRARTGAHVGDWSTTPLVDRERELGLLADVLGRFLRDREPQMVTLVSEPGLGKSRLVAELGRLADQAPELLGWRAGRIPPYGQGVLGALVEIIKAQAGVLDSDDAETVRRKLHHAATALVPDEAAQFTASLQELLGAAQSVEQRTSQRRLLDDAAQFLAAVAARRPLVVVFEDLQWADDALLEFVDGLTWQVGPVPLLVVATGRPEFLDRRPEWGGGQRNAVTTSLSPLSRHGTGELLEILLAGRSLASKTREVIVTSSGGNPLYVEEYARMLAEGSADLNALADGPWPMPETIQQLITARLDALPHEDKLLLQDAAVIGEVGWVGALAAVSGRTSNEVQAAIRRLERRDLLRRRRRSAVAGEPEYAFRHTLLREVAYGRLLRADRAEKHQRAAQWIEALNPDPGERVELLAHHYERALEMAKATDSVNDTLVQRTRQVLRLAGDRALRLKAGPTAERHYRAALELWPAEAPARQELLFRLDLARSWQES